MSNFTQPICLSCYQTRYPSREPVAILPEYTEKEVCCDCGKNTQQGIYLRVNPKTVAFPKILKEEV